MADSKASVDAEGNDDEAQRHKDDGEDEHGGASSVLRVIIIGCWPRGEHRERWQLHFDAVAVKEMQYN